MFVTSSSEISEKTKALFPLLVEGQYRRTSSQTPDYNCIGFALDDEKHWWQPVNEDWDRGMAWHRDAPDEDELATYIRLFELHEYECCDSPDLEVGFEKVAIYWGDDGVHVARQKTSGKWESKLGRLEDIEHDTLELLETDGNKPAYGKVEQILKRDMGNLNRQ